MSTGESAERNSVQNRSTRGLTSTNRYDTGRKMADTSCVRRGTLPIARSRAHSAPLKPPSIASTSFVRHKISTCCLSNSVDSEATHLPRASRDSVHARCVRRSLAAVSPVTAAAAHLTISTYGRGIPCGGNDRGPTADCCGIRRCRILSLRGSGKCITAPHIVSYQTSCVCSNQ